VILVSVIINAGVWRVRDIVEVKGMSTPQELRALSSRVAVHVDNQTSYDK